MSNVNAKCATKPPNKRQQKLSRDNKEHGVVLYVGVYSKEDTMAHAHRLVV